LFARCSHTFGSGDCFGDLIGEVTGTALSFGDWFIAGCVACAVVLVVRRMAGKAKRVFKRPVAMRPHMPLKTVKRRECKLVGDTVTHTPTGKWFSAYPEMPAIYLENMVDVGDYSDCEIRQMAALLLAARLKRKSDN
jgi:hypothetical protein